MTRSTMADGRDRLDDWLRQRLAATLEDAARIPRRRLPFPSGAADRDRHARRNGFVAGALTTAVVFGIIWAGVSLGPLHGTHATVPGPAATPSSTVGRVLSTTRLPDAAFTLASGSG